MTEALVGQPTLYDGWAPFYDELLGEAGFSHIWPAFRHACRRFSIRFTSAADFGCGTGLFLAALARIAPTAMLTGIDRSPAMLAVAKHRLAGTQVRLRCGNIKSVRLTQPVELLTCNFSTLNYLQTLRGLERTLANIARNLRRSGFFIMDMLCAGIGPNNFSQMTQRINLSGLKATWNIRSVSGGTRGQVAMRNCRRGPEGWQCWYETHDQRWWSLPGMMNRLERAGLRTLSVAPLGEVPPAQGGRWVQIVARRM